MTNSEAINEIKSLLRIDFHLDIQQAHELSIKALEENDKLKSEIEQDKRRLENQRNNLIDLRKSYESAIREIEQLKAELEQSVKLPCKVGDKLFVIGMRNKSWSANASFFDMFDKVEERKVKNISISKSGVVYQVSNDAIYDTWIGKIAFLTQEEAEQALKGGAE